MGAKIKNIKGQVFGKLTTINEAGKDRFGTYLWLCKCQCGNTTIVSGCALRKGATQSCGCKLKETLKGKRREPRESNARQAFNCSQYTDGNLTFDDFMELTQLDCYWCGKPPSNSFCNRQAKTKDWHEELITNPFIYNGLDRIDNNKGHEKNNVVTSCYTCNRARGLMTFDEFKSWIKSIYTHQFKELFGEIS